MAGPPPNHVQAVQHCNTAQPDVKRLQGRRSRAPLPPSPWPYIHDAGQRAWGRVHRLGWGGGWVRLGDHLHQRMRWPGDAPDLSEPTNPHNRSSPQHGRPTAHFLHGCAPRPRGGPGRSPHTVVHQLRRRPLRGHAVRGLRRKWQPPGAPVHVATQHRNTGPTGTHSRQRAAACVPH